MHVPYARIIIALHLCMGRPQENSITTVDEQFYGAAKQ